MSKLSVSVKWASLVSSIENRTSSPTSIEAASPYNVGCKAEGSEMTLNELVFPTASSSYVVEADVAAGTWDD